MKNLLKAKLRRGELTIGVWLSIGHPEVPEVLSALPLDWFLFDMEHAPLTAPIVENMLQATPMAITPLVRIPENSLVYAKQALDVGGHGIMVPMVESSEGAGLAVKNAKYPPWGNRGVGARRVSSYFVKHADYLKDANRETMVVPQIETAKAVSNFEEIVTTKGVDAWFMGQADLAASLGHMGETHSSAVKEAVAQVVRIAKRVDIPGGTLAFSAKDAREFADQGFKMIAIGNDNSLMVSGARLMLGALRKG